MQIVVNDLLTTYELQGSGSKTIVLLHGWADTHASFKKLQAALAEKFTVVSFDLPGFGATTAPMTAWDLNDFAGFTAAFLHKLDMDEPYAMVGHSNGGAILIRGISQKILKTEKLILLASAGIRSRRKGRKLMFKAIAKSGKVITAALPAAVRRKLRGKLYKAAGSDMLVAEHLEGTFKKTVGQDILADARHIKLPTLLMYGDQDTDTPLSYGTTFNKAINGSELVVVKGGGHFIHIEQLDKVIRAVERFLK